MSTSSDTYTVVDLFSGAGGLSVGFDRVSLLRNLPWITEESLSTHHEGCFETVFAAEMNEHARKTYEENFGLDRSNTTEMVDDITKMGSSDWEEVDEAHNGVDLIVGGPPCQGFSLLNSKKTEDLDDDRNGLWADYIDAVKCLSPEMFLIENVPRFLDTNEGLQAVQEAQDEGYDVVVGRLWANEYGVPQTRQRAFVIGRKKEYTGQPFFPSPTTPDNPVTVRDAIIDLSGYYKSTRATGDGGFEEVNEFQGLPEDVTWHNVRRRKPRTRKRIEQVTNNGGTFNRDAAPDEYVPPCWKNTNGWQDGMGRLSWDEPAVTIRTGFNDPMKGRYVHPGEDRVITVREGARLQTFPSEFKFLPETSKTSVSRQIGNAVPPILANEIAESIFFQLNGASSEINKGMSDQEPFEAYKKSEKLTHEEAHAQVTE